jgi:hypothetical protein
MNETEKVDHALVCQDCADSVAPRIMYVHLLSGIVKEVPGVTGIEVTQSQVVLSRGQGETPVVFPRWDVYFACCDVDHEPSPF